MSNIALNNSTVKVHYTGRLAEGVTFDSSEGRDPLEFQLGTGMVIPGFNDGIVGMKVGEKKTVNIPVDQAYGPVFEENIIVIPRNEIPADMEIQIGSILNMHSDGEAQQIQVAVADITEDTVTLDANHPLAGKDLIFDIELISVS
jgi:FKBP-type peptidyl-prolyl cis-trans isomerase 2